MPGIEEIKSRNDYSKAMMPDGLAVLAGYTNWCPQCKAMAPTVEKLIKKYPDARFYRYNVDKVEDVAHELGARNVPTFSIFIDGMIEDGVTGAKAQELERLIKENYKGQIVE